MIYFFIFFLSLFSVFTFISKKYSNPYKLYFLFGKKGSGKSLYMVKLMLRYLRKGWVVYSDMDCVKIPHLRVISASDLGSFQPDSKSVIFLDEAGILFDNRNFKNFDKGLRDFFKLQRKYKCRVYLNSQSFDIDKKIRDVVDHMALIVSIGNVFSVYRPIKRSITLTEPSAEAESRIADKLSFESIFRWKFTYLPRYFKYFDSFDAPARPPIPFREVVSDLTDTDVKRTLKRSV